MIMYWAGITSPQERFIIIHNWVSVSEPRTCDFNAAFSLYIDILCILCSAQFVNLRNFEIAPCKLEISNLRNY